MTEVASLLPNNHRLTTVKHYEAGPPAGLELVEPGDTFATTKEEEWVSKKKTEVLNTKQIETRVKRQVVLEDGKVVEDSGPVVTTNTTEDSETQEHHQTELRKLGDDDVDGPRALEGGDNTIIDKSNWVAVPNSDGVVREVKERRVVSREETEEVKETEDVQHLGDISDEAFLAAVRSGKSDIRSVLRSSEGSRAVVSTGPRVIRDTTKSKKVTDKEDTRELSSVLPDGKIVTESQRTTEHEEVNDDELPDDAPEQDLHKESSQRYLKTREQEDVDYLANGKNIGHEMRYKTETMEVDKRGDDETDLFESLSAKARRRANNRQPHRYRGLENGVQSPLDRKDALTRRPLDFDAEEQTRQVETSKWLENHFGSESRSSNSTLDEEEQPPKTSFFNVTIKSQPTRNENLQRSYVTTVNSSSPRVYSPVEPERDRNHISGYYKGVSEWTERRQEHQHYPTQRQSPMPYQHSPSSSPYHADRPSRSPIPDYIRSQHSPIPDYRQQHSPVPDYRDGHSPSPDYGRPVKISASPIRDIDQSPTPPQRKKALDRKEKYMEKEERRTRYDSGYRSSGRIDDSLREERMERVKEPPPDYSPPSPPPMPREDKKHYQKTRFAANTPPPKTKSGNIIGQSIRKLVSKIRSASAERKAKQQRAKRSPSPSYQQGHVIDNNIGHTMDKPPVQRYYLGEDPFGGSIYGRENKYDGVKPARSSRRSRDDEKERRSQSTLGRFSKSSSRLVNKTVDEERSSQTLPRHVNKYEQPTRLNGDIRSNSTINVSIINTVTPSRFVNGGPAKPARTYKSNLARSKSLIVHGGLDPTRARPTMYTSNSNIHRLNENPSGLKSPGLISSLSRSQKDINDGIYTSRFQRNGDSVDNGIRRQPEITSNNKVFGERTENKRVFVSGLSSRSPELFKTVNDDKYDRKTQNYTPFKSSTKNFNGIDVYEPPTRLRDSHIITTSSPSQSVLRRGSTSSTDFSETYHTTTRNDDPHRPSITNTTKIISKKTIPGRDGRGLETINSSETKSITKSQYRSNRVEPTPAVKFYESERRYDSSSSKPVVIEVRNYRK